MMNGPSLGRKRPKRAYGADEVHQITVFKSMRLFADSSNSPIG